MDESPSVCLSDNKYFYNNTKANNKGIAIFQEMFCLSQTKTNPRLSPKKWAI